MPELKLGIKYECYSCSTKFYDLGKSSPTCPKCGADQRDAATAESPAVSPSRRKRKAEVPKVVEVDEEVPIEDLPDDEIVAADLDAEIEVGDEEVEEDFDDDEA
jgi:hypothetical protein